MPPLSIVVPPSTSSTHPISSPSSSPPGILPQTGYSLLPRGSSESDLKSNINGFEPMINASSSRNDIFSSQWKVLPAFNAPPPLRLVPSWSDTSSSETSPELDDSISPVDHVLIPDSIPEHAKVDCSSRVNPTTWSSPDSSSSTSSPNASTISSGSHTKDALKPSITLTPSAKPKGHQKTASGSSTSSRTSSFFDTPMLSPPPPPPPAPLQSGSMNQRTVKTSPSSLFLPGSPSLNNMSRQGHTFLARPKLNQRTSSCPSIPKVLSTPSSPPPDSPIFPPAPWDTPYPSAALDLSEPDDQPAIHSVRLAHSTSYHLGQGANSNVYLSAFRPCTSSSSSSKGKEREWTLAAAKIPIDENGVDGRAVLRKEARVLRWIGSGRMGLVSSYGAVNILDSFDERAVFAVRTSVAVAGSPKSTTVTKFPTYSIDSGQMVNETFLPTDRCSPLGKPVLLLEYCSLGTIDGFVRSHPELITEELFLKWVGELAHGGEWLEARGVIHRDIKPQNILLTASLQPRLTDFGNALFHSTLETQSDNSMFHTTADGSTGGAGTTPYSSPELLLRTTEVSFPSDVFSLGASLYVILNGGRRPYQGVSGTRELCFWVARGGFWDWEERNRAASFGSGPGAMFRRGGSLREHSKGAAAAYMADVTGDGKRGGWDMAAEGSGGGKVRLGDLFGKRATRKAQEIDIVKVHSDEESAESSDFSNGHGHLPLGVQTSPKNPITELVSSAPTFLPFAPVPLGHSSSVRPNTAIPHIQTSFPSLPPSPPLSAPGTTVENEAEVEKPLGGVPMFYPCSTPYSVHEVSEGMRKVLRRMLDPIAERRGSMRALRAWAEAQGWTDC